MLTQAQFVQLPLKAQQNNEVFLESNAKVPVVFITSSAINANFMRQDAIYGLKCAAKYPFPQPQVASVGPFRQNIGSSALSSSATRMI